MVYLIDFSINYFILVKDARKFECRRSHANAASGAHTEGVSITENESNEEDLVGNSASEQNESENEESGDDTDNEEIDHGVSSSSVSPPPSPPPNLESLIERVEELANASAKAQVSSATTALAVPEAMPVPVQTHGAVTEQYANEVNPLTRQDAARLRRGLPLTKYDAFVLYADPDQHYANEMQQKLEKYTEFNFQASPN